MGLGALGWMTLVLFAAIFLAGTTATLLLQYRGRRTVWSWTVIACVAVFIALSWSFLPWETAFAIQSHLSRQPIDPSAVRVSYAPGVARPTDRYRPPYPEFVPVEFALQITDVPDRLEVDCDRLAATIQTPAEETWCSGWETFNSAGPVSGAYWAILGVNRAFFERVKDLPVRLRGSLYLTLFGNRRVARMPAQAVAFHVPGVGVCGTGGLIGREPLRVTCCRPSEGPPLLRSRLVDREKGIASAEESRRSSSPYAPFPMNEGISPLQSLVVAHFWSTVRPYQGFPSLDPARLPSYDVVFEPSEPVAHIRRDFEIVGMRLADYVRLTP